MTWNELHLRQWGLGGSAVSCCSHTKSAAVREQPGLLVVRDLKHELPLCQ